MGLPAAALIPAAGSLVDSVLGGVFQGSANRKNRRFQEKMYKWQRADALADWNMQNTYNSPAAQMQRLKEAGLNPNLVYGDGGSQVQAATVRSASATQGQEQPLTGTRLGEGMRQFYDVQLQNAQLTSQKLMQENLRQDLANKKAQEFKDYAQAGNTIVQTSHGKFDLDRKRELSLQIIEDAWAATGLKKAQIDATVFGNQRAEQLQPGAVQLQEKIISEKDWDIANKKMDNIRRAMENDQYDQMRPIQLAQAKAEIERMQAQTANTKQSTKNEEQLTRINKMEADLGKAMKMIQTAMGAIKR